MPAYYQNPENALKRANEFCEVKKYEEALECLYDTLKSRKIKTVKQIHENIVNKFLELCVDLGRSQTAKDGLYSYRNICQGINLKSWEDSISKYIQLVERKVENAQDLFQLVILDVDDLDQEVTPDDLLKSVSNECSQDRTERVMLLPCLKLLWECHRNCLDLLRYTQTNKLYHTVARSAFKSCVKFSRRTELRKLCNILRVHAAHLEKRHVFVKLDSTEINLLFLETGFFELESAINMELWQDAFRAVENIHSVISVSKKLQHSRIMAHYFDKISCVFWKGEEYLYHAAAVLRYFLLCRDQKKNLSSEEISKLASRVLLSVLSVPYTSNNPIVDLVAEMDVTVIDKKHRLLSNLLDLPKIPSRSTLIKDVIRLNIIQYTPKEFENLFYGVQFDIEPSRINYHISKINDFIHGWSGCNLDPYIPLLRKVTIIRLLSILSKLYSSIKFTKLLTYSGISEFPCLEIILVDAARKYGFSFKIDHRKECMHFSSGFNIFGNEEIRVEREISFPETNLKYLTHTHTSLKKIVKNIFPNRIKHKSKIVEAEIVEYCKKELENYHRKLLLRKNIIEKQKEIMENVRLQKEEEQRKLLAEKLFRHETAEKERLLRETEKRNQQRLRQEQEEIKRKIFLKKMETFKKSPLGSQMIESFDLEDLNNLDPDVLFSKQIEQLNKERKELSSKLRRQERNFDHLERAKRVEEIPLVAAQYNENKIADIEMWKGDERIKLENVFKSRASDLMKKERLQVMKQDLEHFVESIRKDSRNHDLQETEKFLKTLNEEKIKRLKERAEDRRRERRKGWISRKIQRQLMSWKGSKSNGTYLETTEAKHKPENFGSFDKKVVDTDFNFRPLNSTKLTKRETSETESKIRSEIDAINEDSKQKAKYQTSKISTSSSKAGYYGRLENAKDVDVDFDLRTKNTGETTKEKRISKTNSDVCSHIDASIEDSRQNIRYLVSETSSDISETENKFKYYVRFENKKDDYTNLCLLSNNAAETSFKTAPKLSNKPCFPEKDEYRRKYGYPTREFQQTGNYVQKSTDFSDNFSDYRSKNCGSSYTTRRLNFGERNEDQFLWLPPESRNTCRLVNAGKDSALSSRVRTCNREDYAQSSFKGNVNASRPLNRGVNISRPFDRNVNATLPFDRDGDASHSLNRDADRLLPSTRDTDRKRGTITIISRKNIESETSTHNEQTKNNCDSKVLSNHKSHDNRYEASRSCTPWAKLKRQPLS